MTNPTPMTREQAWETVRGTLNDYVPAGDDHFEASQALFFLRTEMERLELHKRNRGKMLDGALETLRQRTAERDELRAEMERLEGERDVAIHAASLVENHEYVAALQQAGVEYVEQLVARIAELEAALRRKNRFIERVANMNPTSGELTLAIRIELQREARAALPDTEGPEELRPVRPGPHIAAMPWSNERTDAWRPDTEGERDGRTRDASGAGS